MTQPSLFSFANESPTERKIKRELHQFDQFEHASRFAAEANGSGKYTGVFIVTPFGRPVVITEREE
jgi:hypothetical protein